MRTGINWRQILELAAKIFADNLWGFTVQQFDCKPRSTEIIADIPGLELPVTELAD
jgi:hypothetical protein